MDLQNQTAIVTGGSRGLGLGIVEALVDRGAKVTVVARTAGDLESVARRLGVGTIATDVTDRGEAGRILSELRPTILVLNAGAPPRMASLDKLSWETFSETWNTDVRAGFHWLQATENKLGIRFQTVVPRQIIAGTGVGDAAAAAYSAKLNVTLEQYFTRFGAPMPPRQFGEHVVTLLTNPLYEGDLAFSLKGDTGISILEGAAV